MTLLIYDGSFEGLLTAIFEVYEYKFPEPSLSANNGNIPLFGRQHMVKSSPAKAARVLKKLHDRLSAAVCKKIYEVHLSEQEGIANVLLRFIQYGLKAGEYACDDFSHEAVVTLHQIWKKVHRERHRMEAFIRFQQSADGLFFASVEPDFDVLPLISSHFTRRYADQQWLIFDNKRKYGMLYDLKEVNYVDQSVVVNTTSALIPTISLHQEEMKFQELWQQYFKSVNIKERKNTALHVRHMPKRYWRYLTEKF
ncbi:MAG: TIGR03915 family putative DNA repair protein [Sphingobacteriaceae bacterium]